MNPFRVITLVLLSLAVILMFYVVVILVPERQSEYAQYQSTVRMNDISARSNAHEARMQSISPAAAQDSVQAALDQAAANEARRKLELAEAEERSVIAAARAKEEAARVTEPTNASTPTAPTADNSTLHGEVVLGKLSSYDAEWATLIIAPEQGATMAEGDHILVKRNGLIVAEGSIDGKDEPSGQYTATLSQNSTSSTGEKLSPEEGDMVVASPFASSDELRKSTNKANSSDLPNLDSLQLDQGGAIKDVDADLIPMP